MRGLTRSKSWIVVALTICVLVGAGAQNAYADNLQLHYKASWLWRFFFGDDINASYYFTDDQGLPLSGWNQVALTHCVCVNIPRPHDAKDERIRGGGVEHTYCDVRAAAFDPGGGYIHPDDFLAGTGEDMILFPWLAEDLGLQAHYDDETDPGNPLALYCGVDYYAAYYGGVTGEFEPGDKFTVENGICAELPGYVFSTVDDIVWNAASDPTGWSRSTDNAFSGSVEVFGELGTCVPEPSSVALLGVGLCGVCIRRLRKRS